MSILYIRGVDGKLYPIPSIVGPAGEKGEKGDTGPLPVKGVDYFTDADKSAMALDVLALIDASSGVHVVVDESKNITLSGELANGDYTLKFENADGSTTNICTLTITNGTGEPDVPDVPDEPDDPDEPVVPDEPDVPVTPTYTNLVPTAKTHTNISTVFNGTGYMDGAYASTSSPYYGTDSATVCTGAIAVTSSDVIYIKGVTMNTTNSHCRVIVGQAHGTNGGLAVSSGKPISQIAEFATFETLGDQYYKLTFVDSYFTSTFTRQPYFFISGIGTGANLIVTANEPIE